MNGRHSQLFSEMRRQVARCDTIDGDRPGVRLKDTGDEVDERALAGAVLPNQGVNLAGANLKADVVEDHVAGERFGQALGPQHRRAVGGARRRGARG